MGRVMRLPIDRAQRLRAAERAACAIGTSSSEARKKGLRLERRLATLGGEIGVLKGKRKRQTETENYEVKARLSAVGEPWDILRDGAMAGGFNSSSTRFLEQSEKRLAEQIGTSRSVHFGTERKTFSRARDRWIPGARRQPPSIRPP